MGEIAESDWSGGIGGDPAREEYLNRRQGPMLRACKVEY